MFYGKTKMIQMFTVFDQVYNAPGYIQQLRCLSSRFRSWFDVIVVIEFDINEGHQVSLEYPPGVLSEKEKNQLKHLSFPSSCATKVRNSLRKKALKSTSKSGWLSFRLRREKCLPLANGSFNEQSFMIGVSLFRTVRDRTYSRGARQECLVVLSSLSSQYLYPFLLSVTLYIGKLYFQYGPRMIYDCCTYINATWPRVPKWSDPPLTLILTTRWTQPMKLQCIAHCDDATYIHSHRASSSSIKNLKCPEEHVKARLGGHSFFLPFTWLCRRSKLARIQSSTLVMFWQLEYYVFLRQRHSLLSSKDRLVPESLVPQSLKGSSRKRKYRAYAQKTFFKLDFASPQQYNGRPSRQRKKRHREILKRITPSDQETPLMGRECDSTLSPYPLQPNHHLCINKLHKSILDWPPYISLTLTLGPLTRYIWELWEIAMTEAPLLIISKTAMRSSAIVLNILRLLYPLHYGADYRPYMNAYDHDLSYYKDKFSREKLGDSMTGAGPLIGGADPLLLQSLRRCANIMVVDVPDHLCTPILSLSHNLIKKMSTLRKTYTKSNKNLKKHKNVCGLVDQGKSPVCSDPDTCNVFSFHQNSSHNLRKDPVLLDKIQSVTGNEANLQLHPIHSFHLSRYEYHQYFNLDRDIFNYFEFLIRHFLCAFEEFVRPNVKQFMINPLVKTPTPLPFIISDFLSHLDKKEDLLKPLYCALGRQRVLQLYQRFIFTRTFSMWRLQELAKEHRNTQLLQLKYCSALNGSDLIAKINPDMAEEGCVTLSQLVKDCRAIAPPSDILAAETLLLQLQRYISTSFAESLGLVIVSGPQPTKTAIQKKIVVSTVKRCVKSSQPEALCDRKPVADEESSSSLSGQSCMFWSAEEE